MPAMLQDFLLPPRTQAKNPTRLKMANHHKPLLYAGQFHFYSPATLSAIGGIEAIQQHCYLFHQFSLKINPLSLYWCWYGQVRRLYVKPLRKVFSRTTAHDLQHNLSHKAFIRKYTIIKA